MCCCENVDKLYPLLLIKIKLIGDFIILCHIVGVDFKIKTIELEGKKIILQIW